LRVLVPLPVPVPAQSDRWSHVGHHRWARGRLRWGRSRARARWVQTPQRLSELVSAQAQGSGSLYRRRDGGTLSRLPSPRLLAR
jgi:hypothetical protein